MTEQLTEKKKKKKKNSLADTVIRDLPEYHLLFRVCLNCMFFLLLWAVWWNIRPIWKVRNSLALFITFIQHLLWNNGHITAVNIPVRSLLSVSHEVFRHFKLCLSNLLNLFWGVALDNLNQSQTVGRVHVKHSEISNKLGDALFARERELAFI